jgi:molecular chaperone DnaK (HSP70)
MKNSRFYPQAKLMIRCIPSVAQESCFALKGGTAINLFVRDMPRLSVDIDLVYLPLEPRETALPYISAALSRIAVRIKKAIPGSKVQETRSHGADKRITKLVIALDGQTVTIEPNEVLGELYLPPNNAAWSLMLKPILRCLFDVKLLLENEGITDHIRKAFVIYLASHDRPISELIEPTRKDISTVYKTDFVEMTEQEVTLDELIKTRERYIKQLKNELTKSEKNFLISLKRGQPDWDLLEIPNIEKLPALQWKLINIRKMKPVKRDKALEILIRKLS